MSRQKSVLLGAFAVAIALGATRGDVARAVAPPPLDSYRPLPAPLAGAVEAVRQRGAAEFADAYAGLTVDETNAVVTVYATDIRRGNALVEEVRSPDVTFDVRLARYSHAQLEEARQELADRTAEKTGDATLVLSVTLREDGSGLEVLTQDVHRVREIASGGPLGSLDPVDLVVTPTAVTAGEMPPFHLPFVCGQRWRLDSWGHAPALDMVRWPDQDSTFNSLVLAAADGVVNKSFWHENPNGTGAGNVIQIDHGGHWFTTYLHLDSRAVSVGQQVYQGQVIGRVGRTGTTANNTYHLHFETAIDANGDGEAIWGQAPGEPGERVRPRLNGVEYGKANNETTYNVYSNNCGEMPGVASTSTRMHVFVRGTDRALYQKTYAGSWPPFWTRVEGRVLSSAPTAVAWTDRNGFARVDVFANGDTDAATGLSNVLQKTSYDGGVTFQPWENIGGNLTTQPAVTILGGALHLFGRGTNGHLWSRKYTGAWSAGLQEYVYSWNAWQERSTQVMYSAPSAASYVDQVQVLYTDTNQRPNQVFWSNTTQSWAGPMQPGGSTRPITGAMGTMQWDNDLEIYGRGTDRKIYFKFFDQTGGWANWSLQSLGEVHSGVGATNFGGHTNLFARGTPGNILWTRYLNGWQAWVSLGGIAI